jgi:AraC-like DNA-binding protein
VFTSQVLLDTPGLRVAEVRCPGHGTGWSAPEEVGAFGIVLVRRGVFRRLVRGVPSLVDSATAYVQVPGTEQRIAHPAGGDVCTSVALPAGTLFPDPVLPESLAALPRAGPVPVTPRIGLVHRLLVARARAGADAVALTDLTAELVAAVFGDVAMFGDVAAAGAAHRGAAHRGLAQPGLAQHGAARHGLADLGLAQRRLVDGARELLAGDPNRALPDLAGELRVSPYHLSRAFHRGTGVTLRRYRMRLRANAALERLADGEPHLAALAAELGFADQAHLTRTLRAETGLPPGRLRALLRA